MAEDLRAENARLREQLGDMRRERDSALIAGSLHVCNVDDREGEPAPAPALRPGTVDHLRNNGAIACGPDQTEEA